MFKKGLMILLCFLQGVSSYAFLRQAERRIAPEAMQYLKARPSGYGSSIQTVPSGYRTFSGYAGRAAQPRGVFGQGITLTPDQKAGLAASLGTRGFKSWFGGIFSEPEQNKVYSAFAGALANKQVPELLNLIETTPAELLNKPLNIKTMSQKTKENFPDNTYSFIEAQNALQYVLSSLSNWGFANTNEIQYAITKALLDKGVPLVGEAFIWLEPIEWGGVIKALLDTNQIRDTEGAKRAYGIIKNYTENLASKQYKLADAMEQSIKTLELYERNPNWANASKKNESVLQTGIEITEQAYDIKEATKILENYGKEYTKIQDELNFYTEVKKGLGVFLSKNIRGLGGLAY